MRIVCVHENIVRVDFQSEKTNRVLLLESIVERRSKPLPDSIGAVIHGSCW